MVKIKVENIGTTETATNNEEESESDIEIPPQVETKPPKTKPQQKLVSCPNRNNEMNVKQNLQILSQPKMQTIPTRNNPRSRKT